MPENRKLARQSLRDSAVIFLIVALLAALIFFLGLPRAGEKILVQTGGGTGGFTAENNEIVHWSVELWQREQRYGAPLNTRKNITDGQWGLAVVMVFRDSDVVTAPIKWISESGSTPTRFGFETRYETFRFEQDGAVHEVDLSAKNMNRIYYTDENGNLRLCVFEKAEPGLDGFLDKALNAGETTGEEWERFWQMLQEYNERSTVIFTPKS